jgi:hypothetical protein
MTSNRIVDRGNTVRALVEQLRPVNVGCISEPYCTKFPSMT